MTERFPSQGHEVPDNQAEGGEQSVDFLSVEEIIAIFDDVKSDETQVVELIRQLALEPIPDLNDQEEVARYNEKMRLVKDLALQHLGRANLLAELQEKIDEKIKSSSPNIDN